MGEGENRPEFLVLVEIFAFWDEAVISSWGGFVEIVVISESFVIFDPSYFILNILRFNLIGNSLKKLEKKLSELDIVACF